MGCWDIVGLGFCLFSKRRLIPLTKTIKDMKKGKPKQNQLSVCCNAPTKIMNDGHNGYGLYCLKCKLPTMGLEDFKEKLKEEIKRN